MKHKNKLKTLLPPSFMWLYFGILLLIGGVHSGLMILLYKTHANSILSICLVITYWIAVAWILAVYSRHNIHRVYDEPMLKLADATKKVASGDFSVYVPTTHSADKYDYIDHMILDFNKMVEELGSIETLKTDFFTNVSHEMKSPLAVISNNAQLLASKNISSEKRDECTENILIASRRLNNLITNMLKLNKLEKQTIKPLPEPYDVCEQLSESVFQLDESMEIKNLEFDADIEDRCYILADKDLMELVWTNLFSNAFKFTPAGGSIKLTQKSVGDFAQISISDNGIGMNEDTIKHIFDKFYQGDTSHAQAGNGLGLALVKRILELSDGEITVTSKVGEGSTFTVRLPLSKEEGI
jgi:signal transduction histidine kinase